jgi:2-polyprenyl-6-hydroxyphenyl methylase/3-demethylubiquinone-9 3-methyltransferase
MQKTIDNAIYDRIPDAWWSDHSFMALLRNAVNPPRFDYFRAILHQQRGTATASMSVLDVGCGGGLLSERFASIGCAVTGVDQSLPTLEAARAHARAMSLDIGYRQADAANLPFEAGQFDVVCCCDVLEHVDDVHRVIGEISRVLKPGGLFFFDTINRTWRSHLLAIKLAQDWPLTRLVPRDVHVWSQFIRPAELSGALEQNGLAAHEFAGLSPSMNPLKALAGLIRLKLGKIDFARMGEILAMRKSTDLSLSYMGFASKARPATADANLPTGLHACMS